MSLPKHSSYPSNNKFFTKKDTLEYDIGYATSFVRDKFQNFCKKFINVTDAINSLLKMDKHLVYKYRFKPNDVVYKLKVVATIKEDPHMLKNSIERLKKYTEDNQYKYVGNAIEELLMSPSKPDQWSVLEANKSLDFMMDLQVKKAVEMHSEYTTVLNNIDITNEQQANYFSSQSIQTSSIMPQMIHNVPMNSGGYLSISPKTYQVPMNNSRYVPFGSNQKQILNKPNAAVRKPIQENFQIVTTPSITNETVENPILVQLADISQVETMKRKAMQHPKQLKNEIQKQWKLIELEVKKQKERRANKRKSANKPVEVISLLEDDEETSSLTVDFTKRDCLPTKLRRRDGLKTKGDILAKPIKKDLKKYNTKSAGLKLNIKPAAIKPVQNEVKKQRMELVIKKKKESKANTKKCGSKPVAKEPLLTTLFSHLEREDQPRNRQEELTDLIRKDVEGDELKKALLEEGLVSKTVVDAYQKKYKLMNKFRS